MEDSWITVATFTYVHDAYIYIARLESEGIECFLKNELMVQSQHLLSNATGGVDLQVHPADVEKAVVLLKDGGYIYDEPENNWLTNFISKLQSFFSKTK